MCIDKIKTVGDLKNLINNVNDDFKIEFRVHKRIPEEQLKNLRYPFPFDTENFEGIDFDDIGHSDKVLYLSVTMD